MSDMDVTPCPLPEGEYAIVEQLGHRTMVGRITEIERFGVKLMSLEPLFQDALLPSVFVGGPSIYQVTPCTREIAWARRPQQRYQLPSSISATLPAAALAAPAPIEGATEPGDDDDDDVLF